MKKIHTTTLMIFLLYELQKIQTRLDRIEASVVDLLEHDSNWLFSNCQKIDDSL